MKKHNLLLISLYLVSFFVTAIFYIFWYDKDSFDLEFGDKEIYYKLLYSNYIKNCRDYRDIIEAAYDKATDSFQSWLQAINLDMTKEYSLIQKL